MYKCVVIVAISSLNIYSVFGVLSTKIRCDQCESERGEKWEVFLFNSKVTKNKEEEGEEEKKSEKRHKN